MDDDRCRLVWKNGEDETKWILRVETYALARGSNNNKMAAIGLPDDKVELWWFRSLRCPVPLPLSAFKLNSTSAGGPPLVSNTNKSAPFLPKRPWSQRRSTLHVLGKVNTIKCTWLLDTGSDVTCISSRLPDVDKWKLTPPQSAPATANGSPLQCLGEITANIEIGHVSKCNIRVLVIKNLNAPAILGMDTLEKFGSFGIDWIHKTLTLGDAKLVLE